MAPRYMPSVSCRCCFPQVFVSSVSTRSPASQCNSWTPSAAYFLPKKVAARFKPLPQEKSPGAAGALVGGVDVLEHERIIRKVLGRYLLRIGHHFERIDLDRCRLGNTGLGV